MARWTVQQVSEAAPDAASVTAARKLARPGPWSQTGSTDALVWGTCQGSGKTPYQVSVDLLRPAYRCSCPSRKFPCKHALALLLMWADPDSVVTQEQDAADFAAQWAAKSAAQQQDRAARAATPPDPAAQAKRLAARLELMDNGIEDFGRWLTDLARTGTAAAKAQPLSWWDGIAARLVDAQVPGLAEQVRDAASDINSHDDWPDRLLAHLGRWWLTVRAWQRRDELDADTMADLRVVLGWAMPADEVRANDQVTDTWRVLGAYRNEQGRLAEQRTWFWGETTGELLVVLDFAGGGQALPVPQTVGAGFTATMARYPGHGQRRALLASDPMRSEQPIALPRAGAPDDLLQGYADLMAVNPWAQRYAGVLHDARLSRTQVIGHDGAALALTQDTDPIPMLAATGGAPTTIFGEWQGNRFRPLACFDDVGAVIV
ncbi:MAG: SWIM zinc finger domain-containing protein [Beutenbergiaceae bacterium]